MKKKIVFLTILLLLVGCGKKGPKTTELKCTKTISDKISSVSYILTYSFEEDELQKVNSNTSLKFTADGIDNLATFKTYAEASKNEYNKKDGVKATLTTNDTTITIDVNYDISKMSEDEINNNSFNLDINGIREKNDNEGYTCK